MITVQMELACSFLMPILALLFYHIKLVFLLIFWYAYCVVNINPSKFHKGWWAKGWEADWSGGQSGSVMTKYPLLPLSVFPPPELLFLRELPGLAPTPYSSPSLEPNEGIRGGNNPLPWLSYFCSKVLKKSLPKSQGRHWGQRWFMGNTH